MCLLCGLLLTSAVVTFFLYRRESVQLHDLELQRATLCTHLEWDLERIVAGRLDHDLQARMSYHHLDQGLTALCLGTDVPAVGGSEAELCFIESGRDDCYRDVAKRLLDLYRATVHEKRLRQQ
jgi:hypothetical protein